jgi:hypothetical protein
MSQTRQPTASPEWVGHLTLLIAGLAVIYGLFLTMALATGAGWVGLEIAGVAVLALSRCAPRQPAMLRVVTLMFGLVAIGLGLILLIAS